MIIILSSFNPIPSAYAETQENVCNTGWTDYFNFGNTSRYYSDVFTASSGYTVSSISVRLVKAGAGPGTVTVHLRSVDGSNFPTGSDLTSGTTDGSTLSTDTTNGELRNVTVTPYTLTNGVKYAILVSMSSGSNTLGWFTQYPTGSCGQFGATSTDGGVNWSSLAGPDFIYEVYSSPVVTATPIVQTPNIIFFN